MKDKTSIQKAVDDFLALLNENTKNSEPMCDVLTGAGISTLSNIPDFRGKNGIYNQHFKGYNPEEILHIDFFYKHPDIFYDWCKDVWYNLDEYEPNIVHTTLTLLQEKGFVRNIFTQNIDMLHQKAGNKNVYELHGSAHSNICTKCGAKYPYSEIAPIVRGGEVPKCKKCGSLIKPEIILYGEGLNPEVLSKAESSCRTAKIFMVLGSSLTVQPAATIPYLALQSGAKLVIINDNPTYLDANATIKASDLNYLFTELNNRL